MAKFKAGDRVRVRVDYKDKNTYKAGDVFTIRGVGDDAASVVSDSGEADAVALCNLELITDYQPITHKLGERYRVLPGFRSNICHSDNEFFPVDYIAEVTDIDINKDHPVRLKSARGSKLWVNKKYVTTEYLELVEEREESAKRHYPTTHSELDSLIYLSGDGGCTIIDEPIKQPNLKTKMTNFIKKLTQSADDKALEKAGFMDSCGDLTSLGRDALISLVFQEKKAELVKLALQVIEENKD